MTYPERPQTFAFRWLRMALSERIASDNGPVVLALLTAVVLEEDRLRYRRPAEFSDGELCAMIGVSSRSLHTVRKTAVDAGLLTYQPARKGVPGLYFVNDFAQQTLLTMTGIDSKFCGESKSDERHFSANSATVVSNNCGESDTLSAKSADDDGTRAIEDISPKNPSPENTPENPPPFPPEGGEEELSATVAEVCKLDPTLKRRKITDFVRRLLASEPPYTVADVREAGRRCKSLNPVMRGRRDVPYLGDLENALGRLRQEQEEEARDKERRQRDRENYSQHPKNDVMSGPAAPPTAEETELAQIDAHIAGLDEAALADLSNEVIEGINEAFDGYKRKDFRRPRETWSWMQTGFFDARRRKIIRQRLRDCVSSEPSP